jgi:hypothetical protein
VLLYPLLVIGALILGLLIGRWWALAAAAAAGVWIATVSEVDEVPGWFLGAAYGALMAAGIAGGVIIRQRLGSRH